ncbi:venom factor-like [Varanus komodoensis]|uniref:venom factor-like n=1 Tax=Varanus komodoensis TaxID=61221 RepID=UPI001CF7C73D|nr:venom factor-like [Varanus komodoensis]
MENRFAALCWLALLLFPLVARSNARPLYMLIAPNTLRVDSEETIVVEAHEHTSPIDILVTIQNFPQKNIILSRAQARLDPEYNMMTSVKIKIPTSSVKKEGQSKQHVYVQATSPLFSLQKIVPLSFQSGYIFIQTDKPIYTPGSSVRYRIFTVGHTLDPQSKAVTTEVANPDGIVVERNLILVEASGIITQVYRVPELSLTGTWKITAKYVDDDIQERFTTELEIKEYVLPNFEVTLESSKKFFYVDDKELIIDISARFLFGEDVQGQAFVIFGVIIHKEKKSIIESLSRVPIEDGKGRAKLTQEMLQRKFPNLRELENHSIYVSVTVLTDTGSDMVQAEKSGIYIVRFPYKIDFPKAFKYFKPGMPFSLMVAVKNPDGSPAPQVPIRTVMPEGGISISQEDGTAYLVVNTEPDASRLFIKVKTAIPGLEDSRQSSANWQADAYQTPQGSGNYLLLSVSAAELKAGDTLSVYFNLQNNNPSTERKIHYFTYLILNKGKVFKAGRQPRQMGQNPVIMSLPITPELIPSFRIVAYYKVGYDEIVADSIWVDVKDTCMGTLKVTGATGRDNKVHQPKERVNLKLRGDPGARVGLVAVDKAVYVLNKKSKLSQAKIWNTVEKKDIGCTAGGGLDVAGVFVDAGLVVQTSSRFETDQPCSSQHRRRRRRSVIISEKKETKAQEYQNQFHRKCCHDGMQENRMGYSCDRRAKYILEGQTCISAFLDCCKHIFETSLTVQSEPVFHSTTAPQISFVAVSQSFQIEDLQLHMKPMAPFLSSDIIIGEVERINLREVEEEEEEEDDDDSFELPEEKMRTHFAESWLWMEETLPLEADLDGLSSKNVPVYLKDSITTWEVLAISLSQTKGICVADPYDMMVKKGFFIDLRLPYSVVRNEQVAIRVVMYNYERWNLNIRMELVYNEKICSPSTQSKNFRQHFLIKAETSRDATYVVIPLELGEVEIEMQAVIRGQREGDGVRKKLRVVPEGMKIFETVKTVILDPSGQGSASAEQLVEIAPVDLAKVVPNTEPVRLISVTGDIVGETIENSIDGANLKHLIRIPSGCGEQNMIGLTPTVIATHYLDITEQWQRIGLNHREEAINIIKKGYTQQLAYRKKDNSYAAFTYRPSSTWLTAYVVKVFAMASAFISVDRQVLCGAVKWLILEKQYPDGRFKEDAPVIHGEMVGGYQGSEMAVSLTAFVVIALQEAKGICQNRVTQLDSSIRKSGDYLTQKLDSLQKSYTVTITAYVLSLLGREVPVTKLTALSAGTHWPDPNSKLYSIEATSYGLMALLQLKKFDLVTPIAHWLTEQRFYGGGYGSTQATIMVFQALAQYQVAMTKNRKNDFLAISLKLPNRNTWIQWRINYENAIMTRTEQTKATDGFTVSVTGTGKGTLSVMTVYYAPLIEGMAPCKKFDVTVSVEESSVAQKPEGALASLDIQICMRFLGETDATMTIVDVSMLTGFSPDVDDLQKLTNYVDKYISKYEMDEVLSDKGSLILYLDKVSNQEDECLKFRVHQYFEVGLIQPGTVTVYEYYSLENRCTKFYHPTRDGALLRTLCQEDTCRCMEEKCGLMKTFTSIPDTSVRIAAACQPVVDYVYKVHLDAIEQKGMYNYYSMKIVQVIKEGTDQAVEGKTRQFISPLLCQETLSMQVNREYLVWGPSSDLWDLHQEMAYLFTNNSWIEPLPTHQQCQQSDSQLLCQHLENFSRHMEETGCTV